MRHECFLSELSAVQHRGWWTIATATKTRPFDWHFAAWQKKTWRQVRYCRQSAKKYAHIHHVAPTLLCLALSSSSSSVLHANCKWWMQTAERASSAAAAAIWHDLQLFIKRWWYFYSRFWCDSANICRENCIIRASGTQFWWLCACRSIIWALGGLNVRIITTNHRLFLIVHLNASFV